MRAAADRERSMATGTPPVRIPFETRRPTAPVVLVEVDREHVRLVVVDEGIASNDSDALPPCAAEMRPEEPHRQAARTRDADNLRT